MSQKTTEVEERKKVTKYNVQQRFTLLNMMPVKGEYFNIKNARIVREEFGLNDSEQEIFEHCTVLFPGGTITSWKKVHAAIPPKAVDVGEWLSKHFRKELKKEFDAKEIRDETIDLYDIFCGIPQE